MWHGRGREVEFTLPFVATIEPWELSSIAIDKGMNVDVLIGITNKTAG